MILLLAVLGGGLAQVETEATVSATTIHEAGQFARTLPSEDPNSPVAQDGLGYQVELVPSARLQLESRKQTLSLEYSPRIFYRINESVPGLEQLGEPLLLHRANLSHSLEVGASWAWTNQVEGALGTTDFASTFVSQAPGDTTPGGGGASDVPAQGPDVIVGSTPYVDEESVRVTTELSGNFDPRNFAQFGGNVSYIDTENQDEQGQSAGTGQDTLSWLLRARYGNSVSQRDDLFVDAEFSSSDFSRSLGVGLEPTTDYVRLLLANLGWTHQLSRRLTSTLLAGGRLAVQSPIPDPDDPEGPGEEVDPTVYPFGSASLTLQLAPTGPVRWATNAQVVVDGVLDQNQGRFVPSALVGLGVQMESGLWSATANAGFVGPLDAPRSILGLPADDPAVDDTDPLAFPDAQTQLSGDLGVARQFPPWVRVYVQVRTLASGPHPELPFFEFTSVQATVLLGLEFTWSTVPVEARRVARNQTGG